MRTRGALIALALALAAPGARAQTCRQNCPRAERDSNNCCRPRPPPPARSGSVYVTSDTDGAIVYVDGAQLGPVPRRVDALSAGAHVVEVRAPGRTPYSESLMVRAGNVAMVRASLTLVAGAQVTVAPPARVEPAGLVAWCRLDGDAVDAISGARGQATGVSPTTGRDGAANGALHFEGAGAVVMSPLVSLPQGASPRTLVVWARVANAPDWRGIANWGRTAVRETFGVDAHDAQGAAMGYYADTPATAVVADGQWHQLAATYDGATLRLWVDGAAAGELTTALNTQGAQLVVGRMLFDHPSTHFLTGDVDDLRVYNRALSGDELRALAGR